MTRIQVANYCINIVLSQCTYKDQMWGEECICVASNAKIGPNKSNLNLGIAHKLHCVGTFLLVRLTCFDFYKLKLIKQYKWLLLLQSDDRWPLSDVKNLWLPR